MGRFRRRIKELLEGGEAIIWLKYTRKTLAIPGYGLEEYEAITLMKVFRSESGKLETSWIYHKYWVAVSHRNKHVPIGFDQMVAPSSS